MKYLVWILGLFAAAVALTTASHNPAYVLLVYPPYRIELSLTLFIVLLLLTFVFGYGLVRLIIAALPMPANCWTRRSARSSKAAMLLRKKPQRARWNWATPPPCIPSSQHVPPMNCANTKNAMLICPLPKARRLAIPPCV